MKRKREYTLYVDDPDGKIYNKTASYRSGMWIVHVLATSIKQAYYLLGHQIVAKDDVGITSVNNSDGPDAGWPWSEKIPYPSQWRR